MSIGTSYTVPLQIRREQPQGRQSLLPAGNRVFSGLGSQDSVRFGQGDQTATLPTYNHKNKQGEEVAYTYRKNNVWVSTEDPYAKLGGLGEVTNTIPTAATLNSTPPGQLPRDMRVITPFVRKMRQENNKLKPEDQFKPTNLTFPVKVNKTETQFRVWQKQEPIIAPGNKSYMRYALESEIFDAVDRIDTYEAYNPESKALLLPFNRGASKLIHYLKPSSQKELAGKLAPLEPGQEKLKIFDADQINVIGNDHLSGPVLYQPEIANDPDIRKGFVYHNIYDSAVPAAEAAYDRGYEVPKEMTKRELYSPLTLSPRVADWAVANRNFAKTIVETDFSRGQKYVAPLRAHMKAGTLIDLHHPLDPEYTPVGNPYLKRNQTHADEQQQCVNPARAYQFVPLAGETKEDWANFKRDNKKALQIKYGLNENPNAVVMSWAARLEPSQKGFFMVKNSIKDLLTKPGNENLQIVIAGNLGKPSEYTLKQKEVDDWIQKFNEIPELKGRVYFPNRFVKKDEITQMNAGSDFTILPSLYEPYGITQLEAYKMGSIPLVHAVDGIRSTVADPEFQKKNPDFITQEAIKKGHLAGAAETVWDYGQTGVLLKPIPVAAYRKALSRDELIMAFEKKVLEAPGKIYTPPGDWKKVQGAFSPLVKMLNELCSDGNLHLPDSKKEDCKTEAEHYKIRLKTRCENLRDSLEQDECPVLTEADLDVLRAIRQVDEEKITHPADLKFEEAVDRALRLSPEDRTKIRENGLKFLNENHSLSAIGERWRGILDSQKSKPCENLEFGPPTFDRPARAEAQVSKSVEEAGYRKRKPTVIQKQTPGILQDSWHTISNVLALVTFYLNPLNWFGKSKKAEPA